jgi:putative hydrolase of the HAD superfamily
VTAAFDRGCFDAILFDYGNTLVQFGKSELAELGARVSAELSRHGPVDPQRFQAVRDRQLSAPYHNGGRENDFAQIDLELLSEVVGVDATPERAEAISDARCAAFFSVVRADESVRSVLESLRREGLRLALVSNYPCGRCIRDTLSNVGLAPVFDVVVVSGEVGWCKPHPAPFRTALEALGVAPERALYVGDNWHADVQGSKRLGMGAVLTEQFAPYQHIAPEPGDHEPDARIATLAELVDLLG